MTEAGLLSALLGGIPYLASLSNLIKLETTCGLAADAVRRLGALGVFVIEDAERLWQRLRLSNDEYKSLASIGEGWWRIVPDADGRRGRALLYRLGPRYFTDRVLVAWSRSEAGTADAAWRDLAMLPRRWVAPDFPLKAADFARRGVAPGPRLGSALRAAEAAWVAADFPRDPDSEGRIIAAGLAAAADQEGNQ
jgi:hypothetical protein